MITTSTTTGLNLQILSQFTFALDSIKFAQAERDYFAYLEGASAGNSAGKSASPGGKSTVAAKSSSASPSAGKSAAKYPPGEIPSLSSQITSVLTFIHSSIPSAEPTEAEMKENFVLKQKVEELEAQVKKLEVRVKALETSGGQKEKEEKVKEVKPAAVAKDEDEVDLFASDEEEDAEAEKVKQQRLAEYAAKKSKKPALVAKSNVILDVKPWDDETDMAELEKAVRSVQMEGLLWGVSKLVPVGYGIKKLQINTVIVDDLVSVDELTEKLEAFEDFVQSVDIAAFNKI
jgi:translation elongation factor EF-1beta